MNSSGLLLRSFCATLIVCFTSTQAYALDRTTRLATAAATQNLEVAIDALEGQQENIQLAEAAIQQEAGSKKAERILKRLTKALPRFQKQVKEQVAAMSDDEARKQLNDLKLPAPENPKQALAEAFYNQAAQNLPQIANTVAEEGIWSIYKKVHRAMKEAKKSATEASKNTKSPSRDIASLTAMDGGCTLLWIGIIILCIVFIASGVAALAVIGFVLFGVLVFPGGIILAVIINDGCFSWGT